MSAFPTTVPIANSLHDRRNELRTEVAVLRSTIAQLESWVEQVERDRKALVGTAYPDDAAFDAAWYPLANALLSAVRNETNQVTNSFVYRIRNAIQPQGYVLTLFQTTSSAVWSFTHNLGYDPKVEAYTWNAAQTVLSKVTPVSVTFGTPGVSISVVLPSSAQGILKLS